MPKNIPKKDKEEKIKERIEFKNENDVVVTTPVNRPDALYSIESVMYSQIAILLRKKDTTEGLDFKEWNRLNDMVKMMKGLTDMELTTTKKSLLEGLSDEEILALVDEAKKTLLDE